MEKMAYVQGTLNISRRALARLRELEIELKPCRFDTGGDWESFWLPIENVREFTHLRGNPANPSLLYLADEQV